MTDTNNVLLRIARGGAVTAQEIFDVSVGGMLRQRRYSADGNRCKYRGPHGARCALGHLIPDVIYSEGMEGYNWISDHVNYRLPSLRAHYDLAEALQRCHDNAAEEAHSWEDFADSLRRLGVRHGLDTSVIDEVQAAPNPEGT